MRCPACNHDSPVKPEIVIQKEPCKCGLTEFARTFRMSSYCVIAVALGFFSSCISEHYWTTKQIELMREKYEIRDKKNSSIPEVEKIGVPFDVKPKR